MCDDYSVEWLEVGTVHMCLSSVSGYRPLIDPPLCLGNLLLDITVSYHIVSMFKFIQVSFSFFVIFRVRVSYSVIGLRFGFGFGIGNLKHI